MITGRELCLHAWAIARERFPPLGQGYFERPWPINLAKLPPKGAKARVDEICFRAAAFWLEKSVTSGELEKKAIPAGELRRRISRFDGIAVPRAVILAVAVSQGSDIYADDYDVWISRFVDNPDDIAPV